MFSVLYGLQGSGKSYEGVLNYVLPGIRSGRRVVSNIAGLNPDLIYDYLVAKGAERDKLGELVVVTNERVAEPNFFCGEPVPELKVGIDVPEWIPIRELSWFAAEYTLSTGKTFGKTAFQLVLSDLKACRESKLDIGSCLVEAGHQEWSRIKLEYFKDRPRGEVFAEIPVPGPSVVQPGDLVVIDECWRYWGSDVRLSAEHRNFFRMHRHYVRADGVSCDLVGLTQDYRGLNPGASRLVKFVVHFRKLNSLGLMNRYRFDTYESKVGRDYHIQGSPWQKYNPEIFPLYKSFDGNGGKEVVTDKRSSLFSKSFVFIFGGAFLGFVVLAFIFFKDPFRKDKFMAKVGPPGAAASSPAGVAARPVGAQAAAQAASAAAYAGDRLVGVVAAHPGHVMLIVQLADGRTVVKRVQEASVTVFSDGRKATNFIGGGSMDGWGSWVDVEGRKVTFSLQAARK